MARKTIKELELIVEELEAKVKEYMNIINDRNKQIEQMQGIADNSFENSPTYVQMYKEIEYLKTVIKAHEITIKAKEDSIKGNMNTIQKLLKENEELKNNTNNVQKIKNERGAGRKERFTEEEKATVKMLRLQNKSYRAIAKELNCSAATVHKIINEQNI